MYVQFRFCSIYNTNPSINMWFIIYLQPCVPIVISKRATESISKHGTNSVVEWKPDSNMLVVAVSQIIEKLHFQIYSKFKFSCFSFQTTEGTLLLYILSVVDTPKGIYNQIDPPSKNLCRDSAELFLKETIPSLSLTLVTIRTHLTKCIQNIQYENLFFIFSAFRSSIVCTDNMHLLCKYESNDGCNEK